MHCKTKRNDHRRDNKHSRKEWQEFCKTVKDLKRESIDIYIEKQMVSKKEQLCD